MSTFNTQTAAEFIAQSWKGETPTGGNILKTLSDYIAIPNQSPQFDPDWQTNGHQERAVELLVNWVKAQKVNGLTHRVLSEKGRTPLIYIDIPGTNATKETVLLYGHMDKQPPMTEGWEAGLGPWTPVLRGDQLFGRGGADDGYSVFAAVNAIQALQQQGIPHARSVILIEACEESGSRDLPHYMDVLKADIGEPSLVVCLDSGCLNYEQMWLTTSLRGMLMATLRVDVLTQAVHSGGASGIVPSSFRILRQLLDRLEDPKTGQMHESCYMPIPAVDINYAKQVVETVGDEIHNKFPWAHSAKPVSEDNVELVLNNTWRPTMSVTGVDGMPDLVTAGNVIRSHTTVKLSIRLPPTADPEKVGQALKKVVEADVPYNAKATFEIAKAQGGWSAPVLDTWLSSSLQKASESFYGKPVRLTGEGGSIPFMGMLGEKFPKTQFVITGVLGPGSNAHGPNEFIHVPFAQKLTGCVAQVLADHYAVKHA